VTGQPQSPRDVYCVQDLVGCEVERRDSNPRGDYSLQVVKHGNPKATDGCSCGNG